MRKPVGAKRPARRYRGPMKPSEALTNHRAELRQLVSRYGLSRPRVFGSVLTGTDTEGSDLDLLVDPADTTSLFTIAGLQIDAEKLLGVTVSVLTPNGLPPRFATTFCSGPSLYEAPRARRGLFRAYFRGD
jgi:predicted nucleotidyltransferase